MDHLNSNDPPGEWVDIPSDFTSVPYTGDLPPRLYRYRSYTEENWRARLESEIGRTEIFLSPAGSLNDPEEILPEVRLIGEVHDIRTYWRSRRDTFAPPPQTPGELESEIERRTLLTLESHCGFTASMYRNYISQMAPTARIACFSEHEDSPVMWGHYGVYRGINTTHAHGGLVLQYSVVDDLRNANLHPVSYQTQRPTIDLLNKQLALDRSLLPAFTTKHTAWSYEREWRMFGTFGDLRPNGKSHPKLSTLRLAPHLLTGVYIGLHTPQQIRDEVVRLILAKEQPPRLYEIHRDRHTLGLTRREVVRQSLTCFDLQPIGTGQIFL